MAETPAPNPDHAKLLEAAFAELKLSEDAFGDQRTRELEDLKFEAGEHWTAEELKWKKEKSAPAFVMDLTSPQIAKVTNAPVHQIVVGANDGKADPKSAELWQGLCRRVESLSNADAVYKWARRHAAIMGRGFWRIRADVFSTVEARKDGQYDPSIFHQDIRIEAIRNQHSVFPDPRVRTLDHSDQRFTIITDDVHWSSFPGLFPDAKYQDHASYASTLGGATGNAPPSWANEQTSRVAERYWIEDEVVHLCILKPGTLPQDGATPLGTETVVVKTAGVTYPKDAIVREHKFLIPKVKWMKFNGAEVLEGPFDVPGRYIPVVMIAGELRIVDGKTDYRGMVRMAKHPQRLLDFMESKLASVVDLSTYDTWLASVEAVGDRTNDYTNAHIDRPGLLLWNAVPPDAPTERLPEPRHITVAGNIAPVAVAAQRASMTLRAVLEGADISADERRPEQSGKAILARQKDQAQAKSHYVDCTGPGIELTAKMILSMGRVVWDTPRLLRIIGKDNKPVDVIPHAPEYADQAKQMAQEQDATSKILRHALSVDVLDFDITVRPGKGYENGREETVERVQEWLPILSPPKAEKAVAVMARNSDFAGADELATIIEPDPDGATVPREEAEKAQQVIDMQTQAIAQLEQQVASKAADLASAEKIAADNNASKELIAKAEIELKQQQMAIDAQLEELKLQAEIRKAEIAAQQAVDVARLQPPPQPSASPEFGA